MSTSSSIPVLGDVLFYTPNDPYNFQADNRPIYNLDSNIRHINTSLSGVGYGEHAAVAGGLLSAGRAVELLTTGLIRYPVAATAQSATTGVIPVIGLVVGSTSAGLNRVIWASEHLDLSSVGLGSLLSNPAQGLLLVSDCSDDITSAGVISAVSSPSASQVALGTIKTYPYVTISSFNTATNTGDVASYTADANHHNLYGFTRFRNLLLAVDAGETPIQYQKKTFYMSDMGSQINPFNVSLSANLSQIIVSPVTAGSVTYDVVAFSSKIVKERYVNFVNLSTNNDTVANASGTSYSWSNNWYTQRLIGTGTSTYENYELDSLEVPSTISGQPAAYTPDFSLTLNLPLFETFVIEKYYQYAQVDQTNSIMSGKLTCTATVFNPSNVPNQGGESQQIIIWNFYSYDASTGLERSKYRIETCGGLSTALFADTSIFPNKLVNLQ
jgi:hypothetical protein